MKDKTIKSLVYSLSLSLMFGFLFSCSKDEDGGLGPGGGTSGSAVIQGIAYDAVSFEALVGATITLEKVSGGEPVTTTVNQDGRFTFASVAKTKYNLTAEHEGYKTMFSKNVDLSAKDELFVAFLLVEESITTPVGGVAGIVLDENGLPLQNANLAISAEDESITNGYFSSTESGDLGEFYLGAVPLQSTQEFKVRCLVDGYKTAFISNITIEENEMVTLVFNMVPESAQTVIYEEDFTGNVSDWHMTGFWHVQQNADIYNSAYPTYVKLAPNDNSQGRIPNAVNGNKMLWYGEAATGNFMGPQSEYDYELSGGTGTTSNSGYVLSPEIDLTSLTQASFNFRSWFEIESVNPNMYGFDLMEVIIVAENGDEDLLARLNPYTDPILSDRAALPFTSGGFNQAPVWKFEEFDLINYVGSKIRIKFQFDTRDALYNGFRGWFIDGLRVLDRAPSDGNTRVQPDAEHPLMQR